MVHHAVKFNLGVEKTLSIFVFGDRQAGQSGFKQEAWQQFRNEFKSTPGIKCAIGLGDYEDWLRPTMREALAAPLAKDDSAKRMLDNMVRKENDKTIDDMDFLKEKIIALHEGHHTWKFAEGITTDQRLASALKVPFVGWQASTRLILSEGNDRNAYTILSTHGNANSRTFGGSVSWMESRLTDAWIADHYIMGHGCKNGNFEPYERNFIKRNGPPGIKKSIVRCLIVGGFSEAFTNGWKSDYVERNGFTPQATGWGLIRLKIKLKFYKPNEDGQNKKHKVRLLDVEQINRHPQT